MKSLAGAIQFLTILRVPAEPVSPGLTAAWFPLIGAAIGAVGAGVFWLVAKALPASLAALAVIVFWTVTTGVLHEDGLADVADAVRAGRSRERMLAILKDSRIGAFGAIAIVVSFIARWQALEYFAGPSLLATCIAAQAVPRAAMVGLAWASRPAGDGLGYALASTLTTSSALAAIAQGLIAAFLCGPRAGAVIALSSFVVVRLARSYFYTHLGGINGDCLGATEQILEIFILALFACQACSF